MWWGKICGTSPLKNVAARSLFIWTSSQMRKLSKALLHRGTCIWLWKRSEFKTEVGRVLGEEEASMFILFSCFPGHCL